MKQRWMTQQKIIGPEVDQAQKKMKMQEMNLEKRWHTKPVIMMR